MIALKKSARIAGLLYLILAVAGAYGIMYVPSQLLVPGNAEQTVSNMLQHEFLFRTGIFANLACQTVFIFLALQLYKLFAATDQSLSRALLVLVVAGVPVSFFIIFNQLYALVLLKEGTLAASEPAQINAAVLTLFKMYDYGIAVVGIFWGLWLIPFGQLFVRAAFMPNIIGYLLIAGGLAYVIDSTVFILVPEYRNYSQGLVSVLSSVAEIATVFWLLIKGVRGNTVTLQTAQ